MSEKLPSMGVEWGKFEKKKKKPKDLDYISKVKEDTPILKVV